MDEVVLLEWERQSLFRLRSFCQTVFVFHRLGYRNVGIPSLFDLSMVKILAEP